MTTPAEPREPVRVGRFLLVRHLGGGGQGSVFLARDPESGRDVALKVLPREPSTEASRERLRREAAVSARIDHPSIRKVLEVCEQDGTTCVVMEYVEGRCLDQRIREERAAAADPAALGSPDRIAEIVRFFERAAVALHAAHRSGFVHRDIKPANLLVASDGRPVILDFGLARDDSASHAGPTATGEIVGTPRYLSPEQIEGRAEAIDCRTDVWSLAVTLQECLTLEPPFRGNTRESLYRAIFTQLPPDPRALVPGIPRSLGAVLLRALEKDPARRHADAGAFAADLASVRERRPIPLWRTTLAGRLLAWVRRRPALAGLVAASALLVTLLAGAIGVAAAREEDLRRGLEESGRRERESALASAYLHLAEGSPREAVAAFRLLASGADPEPDALAGLGLALLAAPACDPAEVLALWDRHRTVVARCPELGLLRADALRRLGRGPEADALESGVAPTSTARGFFIQGLRAIQRGHAGDAGSFRAATAHLKEAVLHSRSARAIHVFELAHAAAHSREDALAAEAAAAIEFRWPESGVARFWLGFVRVHLDPPRAIPDFRRAIALGCRPTGAYINLSILLRSLGQMDEGRLAAEEALAIDPGNPTAHLILSLIRTDAGDVEGALRAVERAIDLAPRLASARFHRGGLLHRSGRLREASTAVRESLELEPANAETMASLGAILRDEGLYEESEEVLRRAIAVDPGSAEAFWLLADVQQRRIQLRDSVASAKQAHALGTRKPGWPYPSAETIGDLERILETFEAKLESARRGEAAAWSRPERVEVARFAAHEGWTALAARMFADVIREDPAALRTRMLGIDAGRAAARAAGGEGRDAGEVDAGERRRFRECVGPWLHADVRAFAHHLESADADREGVAWLMRRLKVDPVFELVRGPAGAGSLTQREEEAWARIRDGIDEVLEACR